jgi:O-antigen/teichoic acid export membrane protein
MGRIYGRALRYLLMIALPIAIGGWSLADQIVPFLFDDQYERSIQVLQIVIWVVPLMYASEFLGYIVLIQGNERQAARAVIVSTSVNVIMNLIVVPRYGLLGAAVLTVVTEAVLVGQYVWLLRAQLQQLPLGQVLLRPLLAALLMGGVVLTVNPYVPELFPHLRLLVSIAAGVATYAGLLILLGVIGKDELRFAQSLRRRADTSESSA